MFLGIDFKYVHGILRWHPPECVCMYICMCHVRPVQSLQVQHICYSYCVVKHTFPSSKQCMNVKRERKLTNLYKLHQDPEITLTPKPRGDSVIACTDAAATKDG